MTRNIGAMRTLTVIFILNAQIALIFSKLVVMDLTGTNTIEERRKIQKGNQLKVIFDETEKSGYSWILAK